MRVLIMKVSLRASWVHSLKEKRMIVLSITKRLRNKFNISVAEIDNQDVHQTITIGICGICSTSAISDSTMENILDFIEENCEAEIIDIVKDEEVF